MKNLILVIVMGLFAVAGTGYAQSCSHASKASAKTCVKPSEAALKAASMDATIETKVCEKSGKVCFLKKSTDAEGNVASAEVMYDEATAQFVSLPAESDATTEAAAGAVKSCSKSKACCSKGSKSGKACCKSKGTASVSAPENAAPAQNIKSE